MAEHTIFDAASTGAGIHDEPRPYAMMLSDLEKDQRRQLRGAVKGQFDREHFHRDTRLVPGDAAGCFHLVNVTSGRLIARLSQHEADTYTLNPHIRQVQKQLYSRMHLLMSSQVFGNGGKLQESALPLQHSDRIIPSHTVVADQWKDEQRIAAFDDWTRCHATSVNHWGQRKLLLAEIEFMTRHGDQALTVVYAGASPGVLDGGGCLHVSMHAMQAPTCRSCAVFFQTTLSFLLTQPRSRLRSEHIHVLA